MKAEIGFQIGPRTFVTNLSLSDLEYAMHNRRFFEAYEYWVETDRPYKITSKIYVNAVNVDTYWELSTSIDLPA